MTTTATPEDRRALAQEARRARAAHIIGLRRRVVATALATLVLATAVVAWDGPMGAAPTSTSSSTAASGGVLAEEEPVRGDPADASADDPVQSSGSASSDAASSADVVTTRQS